MDLHFDVDNFWTYRRDFGLEQTHRVDSVYAEALPQILDILNQAHRHATFFIIGKDVEASSSARVLSLRRRCWT